ncbi:PQQ-dependent sugar dehydrogenase [Neolewinella litorea]|uniref:Glucose dehydrogenase n=1 Tax=Neolewinella litorea TaxID=2562452 RepID=A0A4V3XL85_9BACT|nr:PQQ-dependent sugar dehydrogenase [Neolewinella litorea]THH39883.1 glucose dehydrogenase [Neolewinella litorea]
MKHIVPFSLILTLALLLQGCYGMLPSDGGGQIAYTARQRYVRPADVWLPEGYRIEVVASGLTFPTDLTFDEEGIPHVVESGYAYGEIFLQPKLLRLDPSGDTSVIYAGTDNGPWNGVTFSGGHFYIAEGGQLRGGKILKVGKDGTAETLVSGLPSYGDHHTNGPVVRDGYVYFGQGTATNSAVVGVDNADYGWLNRYRDFHDIPCEDITVRAYNYTTDNVLTEATGDQAVTGPYSPYNQAVTPGELIRGSVPCNGAVMRLPQEGGALEVVAWGLRNPYGMAFSPAGELFVTDNMYDVRGSRPLWGTGDLLWKIESGKWYGWPDYYKGIPVAALEFPGKNKPQRVLAQDPGEPPRPVAGFGVHSSATGMDFAHSDAFGFGGQAFVALFGDLAPVVGKALSPVGYQVVRVDPETGIVEPFAVNRGDENAPASRLRTGGLERPIAVTFGPNDDALYVVDFGIVTTDKRRGAKPRLKTGVVWKISKEP